MSTVLHLLRPGAAVDEAVAAAGDIRIHLDLEDSRGPVYVKDGRAVPADAVIELIVETDHVIVW